MFEKPFETNDNFEKDTFENFDRNNMFRDQLAHFIDCVKNHKEPVTNLVHSKGSHMIAMAIKEAIPSLLPDLAASNARS